MKLNGIKHVFFDLDHTLWDFDKNSSLAFASVFKKHNISIKLPEFLEIYRPINLKYWKLYRADKISRSQLRQSRLKESFNRLNLRFSEEKIEEFSRDYITYLPQNNYLLEGVAELLEYLRPNYSLHIISNGPKEVQHKKLRNAGINTYFFSVTTSEDAGAKKPNKLIFEYALKSSGATIENSLMIGDDLEADIIGAREFGMKALLYNCTGQECPAHIIQVLKMKDIGRFL